MIIGDKMTEEEANEMVNEADTIIYKSSKTTSNKR